MWADWKNKTKKKANIILRRKSYSLVQPTPTLTNLELRLLKMINYPIDDKHDALRLEMVSTLSFTKFSVSVGPTMNTIYKIKKGCHSM